MKRKKEPEKKSTKTAKTKAQQSASLMRKKRNNMIGSRALEKLIQNDNCNLITIRSMP
jgi:hypothetical protein